MHKRYKYLSLLYCLSVGLIGVSSFAQDQKRRPLQQTDQTQPDTMLLPVVTIPIELISNRIHLNLLLNDKPVTLLLDTGASASVLFEESQPFFSDLIRTGITQVTFPATNQTVTTQSLAPVKLAFENTTVILNKTLILARRDSLQASFFNGYDGIIGQELFEKYTVEINARDKTLSLYKAGTDLSSLYRSRHKLFMQGSAPHIQIRNQMPWEKAPRMKKLLIDTGYPGAMVIWNAKHFRRATSHTEWKKLIASNTGIISRASFSLGKLRFLRVPVFLGANPPFQVGDRDGILGGNILNNYRYAIDFKLKKMWTFSKSAPNSFESTFDASFYPPNDEPFIVKDFKEKFEPFAVTVFLNDDGK